MRTLPLSDVFAPIKENVRPACRSRAFFRTLVALCCKNRKGVLVFLKLFFLLEVRCSGAVLT